MLRKCRHPLHTIAETYPQWVLNPWTSDSKSSTFLSELIWHVLFRKSLNFCSFTTWFLAELLLWYLTGNISGIEVSCRRCVDDVQMTHGWHADDLWMTWEWDFGWDFTGGWHMSSGTSSRHLPELPNFMQYYTWCHLHVIRSQRN